jgi:hypothetical protein
MIWRSTITTKTAKIGENRIMIHADLTELAKTTEHAIGAGATVNTLTGNAGPAQTSN